MRYWHDRPCGGDDTQSMALFTAGAGIHDRRKGGNSVVPWKAGEGDEKEARPQWLSPGVLGARSFIVSPALRGGFFIKHP